MPLEYPREEEFAWGVGHIKANITFISSRMNKKKKKVWYPLLTPLKLHTAWDCVKQNHFTLFFFNLIIFSIVYLYILLKQGFHYF